VERDLSQLLTAAAEADERALAGMSVDAPLERAHRGVRRRRAVRHARTTVLSVAGIAALGAGALLVGPTLARDVDPASTPTDGATTSSSDPTPTADEVAAGVGLPSVLPLPADVWDRAAAGWTLGIYRPVRPTDDGSVDVVRNTLVLASPTGERYRVLELPRDREVELVRWVAGQTRALVTVAEVDESGTHDPVRGWLDLRSGELRLDPGAVGTPDGECPAQISYELTDADGDEVWRVRYCQTGGGGASELVVQQPDGTLVRRVALNDASWEAPVDPSGRYVVTQPDEPAARDHEAVLVDLATETRTTLSFGVGPERTCGFVAWRSEAALVVACRVAGEPAWWESGVLLADDELWDVPVDGATPQLVRTLTADGPALALRPAVGTGAGLVLGTDVSGSASPEVEPPTCTAGLVEIGDDGSVTRSGRQDLAWVHPVAVTDDGLRYVAQADCAGASGLVVQTGTGTPDVDLLPNPPVSELQGGLTTWATADGPSARYWWW